jgi:hypothetical protein
MSRVLDSGCDSLIDASVLLTKEIGDSDFVGKVTGLGSCAAGHVVVNGHEKSITFPAAYVEQHGFTNTGNSAAEEYIKEIGKHLSNVCEVCPNNPFNKD